MCPIKRFFNGHTSPGQKLIKHFQNTFAISSRKCVKKEKKNRSYKALCVTRKRNKELINEYLATIKIWAEYRKICFNCNLN